MSRENQPPATIEAGPPRPDISSGLSKNGLLRRVGAAAGALILAASLSPFGPETALGQSNNRVGGKAYHPLEYVGVTSDQIWVPNFSQALQAAQQIAETGANTVRIFEPYSPGQAEINNDRESLCDAAEAAREENLTLEISFMGHHHDKVNFVPSNASAITKFQTTIGTILWNIAGPNANKPGPNGSPACVQEPLKDVMIEEENEVNSNTFNSNKDAPQKYAYLTVRLDKAIDAEVTSINNALESSPDPNISAPLKVQKVIGGLAAGHNDVLTFLKSYDSALKIMGVTTFPGDMLAVHPYPANPLANPANVEASLYQPVENELRTSFGEDIPIFYDEIGVGAVEATKKYLYGPRSLSAASVTTGLQAQYYRDTFKEAASEPDVVGVLTFQGRNNPNDGWPDGFDNPNGSHTGAWNSISTTYHDARNGSFDNNP